MMVNSKHVFSVTLLPYKYQVIDDEEESERPIHRYTVIKWTVQGFKNGGVMVAQDNSIYSKTKWAALRAFMDKEKRGN